MKLKNGCMLLLTALIWGMAFVAQSVGMDYVGPFTFNAVRSIIGGMVLIPCIYLLDWMNEKRGIPSKKTKDKDSKKTLILGGICCGIALCGGSNLQQLGIVYTTVGKAGFITALYIVIVPMLGIFLGKKVEKKIWFSIAIAVAGLYFLCMKGSFSLGKGDVLVLICAVVFSIHILVIDHFTTMVDGVRMSCIQFFVCGIISSVLMLIFETPSVEAILLAGKPILYAGILSCGVAYTLQIIAQKDMSPTISSLILSLESVFSVIAGWIILGQRLSSRELWGCLLMFTAIILAQLPERRQTKIEQETSYDQW